MRYEGAEGVGRMLIANPDHPNIEVIISLSSKVGMNDHRAVRKLLEITSGDTCLLTDSEVIYGIGRSVGLYDYRREDLFQVNFTKHYIWELQHANHIMMRVDYGQPQLPRFLIDKEKFINTVKRIFKNTTSKGVENLWNLTMGATRQKHGTMVVVSSEAKEEGSRLGQQAIQIDPMTLNSEIIGLVTSIDGAVLVDSSGTCYAIGVILDGIASKKGSVSRGARYNSAIRYIDGRSECLAIVISVDGSVDLIPDLRPQIKRSSIDDTLNILRKLSEADEANIREFNKTMGWFEEHRFYLEAEVCKEINELRRIIEGKFPKETNVRIIYNDFIPNEEMDASYFLEESRE